MPMQRALALSQTKHPNTHFHYQNWYLTDYGIKTKTFFPIKDYLLIIEKSEETQKI